MIYSHFNTTYTIKRSGWTTDGDGNPYSTESTQGIFYGHIQQASAELVANLGLTFTKAFTIWCAPSTAVLEGDTITDGTNTYSVRAIQSNQNGENAHLELIVESDDV